MSFSNYARTGPFTNNVAPGVSAAFLNALEAVLERNSGDTESGGFYLSGWSNASGDVLSLYMPTLSRTSVPVSVSLTVTSGPTNIASPSTGHLDANGFQIFSTSTSAQIANLQCGGTWTVTW